MNPRTESISRGELVDELSGWTVGLGILTMALAPLAIPMVALTAVAAVVLLLPVLAVGLLGGLVALAVLLVRASARQARRVWTRRGASERRQPSSSPGAHRSWPGTT
jgi:hypothetical protein